MATVGELIDRGVRAYTRGDAAAAEQAWREALLLEPRNERVLAYLRQVRGERPAPPGARPVAPPSVSAAGDSPWDAGPAAGVPVVVVEEDGGGLDLDAIEEKSDIHPLVSEHGQPRGVRGPADAGAWMEAARERFELGDFSGSLTLIERILHVDPTHAEARAYLRQNEATLVAMHEAKLGPLSARPRLVLTPEEILWLNLDHRAGFLLAQVDGTVSYEDLFALSGLPRLDTARILADLVQAGVVR